MKLISCKSYILERKNGTPYLKHDHKECVNYANFLNTPLSLGVFIPCDEQGNVLVDPESTMCQGDGDVYYSASEKDFEDYSRAEGRVVFEGDLSFGDYKGGKIVFLGSDQVWVTDDNIALTIEDLTKYDLTINTNTVKRLGI